MSQPPRLLGVACSLRNARWGAGSEELTASLTSLPDEEALGAFLERESSRHLENFMEAGRREGLDFAAIYRNLQRRRGDSGLSNSETALAAGLWSAHRKGVDIEHVSLTEHFPAEGPVKDAGVLAAKLRRADGLLVSGPVYFGDRGSLAESLLDFIRRDPSLRHHLEGVPYGGIAVGAKRNGGQETTLVYQMLDAMELGLLAVGNDSKTTAQYGGTGYAGDVGTMHADAYGLGTSMGVGRRLAHVMRLMRPERELTGPLRLLFIVLREAAGMAQRTVDQLVGHLKSRAEISVLDVTREHVRRCIACDICPTHVDDDSVYRCIIRSKRDSMSDLHPLLLGHDVLVPVVADARDATRIVSAYQHFVERTRYLRRGDYVFSDQLVVPLLATEVGARGTYGGRMTTSFIRHHTVMSRPVEQLFLDGAPLAAERTCAELDRALGFAERLVAGRLETAAAHLRREDTRYNPVGYVLSAHKAAEDDLIGIREQAVRRREDRLAEDAAQRLGGVRPASIPPLAQRG